MSLTTDIPAFLLAQPMIAALVETHIYPTHIDEGEVFPCLVFFVVSDVPLECHDGPSRLSFAHVQFSCFAKRYADARALRDALKALLESFTGPLAPGGTQIGNARWMSDHDSFESSTRVYHVICELELQYAF